MKLNTGKLAVFSLVLNVLFVLFFIGKRIYYSHSAPPLSLTIKDNEAFADLYNKARIEIFNEMPIDSTDIVFTGNSITEGFCVTELFHSWKIKNRGIGWNETGHLLGRLPDILKYHPKKVFLEIGVNDFNVSYLSADSAFTNYRKILESAKELSPQTQMIVQLVMPTCMAYARCEPQIKELNSKLLAYCKEQNIAVVDLYTPFLKNGGLDSTLTYDGIHLNGKGYKIWKQQIDSLVK